MDQKYFGGTPFALSGDRDEVPLTTVDGSVSYTTGFGEDYSRDLGSDPLAKPIRRLDWNGIMYDVTEAIGALQLFGYAEWVSAADNGGVPVQYGENATVIYRADPGDPFLIYRSLLDGNTAVPTDAVSWADITDGDDLRAELANATDPTKGAALVGYRGRTVYQRMSELVSLKDFGAIGDGVADDTVAVQAAIDSGLPLFVPAGNFRLTATLTKTTSNLYIQGCGPMSKFTHSADYGDTLRVSDPAGLAVVENVVILDVMFRHDTSVQATSGTHLKMDAVRNFWVRGVHTRDGFRGIELFGCDQGHMNGNYVLMNHNNGGLITGRIGFGVYPTANTGKTAHPGDVFISDLNVRCGSTPVMEQGFLMTAGDGIWLINSHVGNCTLHTVRVNANNSTKCTGLLMDNCWIDIGLNATGMRFEGSGPTLNGNHYVRNCKFLGGGTNSHGLDIAGPVTRIRLTNNEISDYLNNGIFVRADSTGEITIKDNVVRDNSMAGSGTSNGINHQGTGRTYIQDNSVSGANHAFHIALGNSKSIILVDRNDLIGAAVSSPMNAATGTIISQRDNIGFNPTGNQAVTVGASPWTYTNNLGYPVMITVGGGTVTALSKSGTALTGLTSGAFTLARGESLTVTYSVAPTARLFGL